MRRVCFLLLTIGCSHVRVEARPAARAPEQFVVQSVSMPPMWIMSASDPLSSEVRFRRGSTEPLALSIEELDRVAAALRGTTRIDVVGVSGHVEPDESEELATKRAARVIELLVERGVDRSRFELRSATSSAPPERVGVCGVGPLPKDWEELAQAEERWVRFSILRSNEN